MIRLPLHWQVLIALGVAVVVGVVTSSLSPALAERAVSVYTFIGTLFLQALKLLIVPLIVSSMITGMAGLGSGRELGRLGGKTLLYYIATTLFAILVGLMAVNFFVPGVIEGEPVRERIGLSEETEEVTAMVADRGGSLTDVFLRMVPPNIVAAAAGGKMLGLIVFSLVFGYFLARIEGRGADVLKDFWKGVFDVMMRITEWVLLFLPIGVFGLVASVISTTGMAAVAPLALFMITVLSGLSVHFLVVLPLLLRFAGGVSPLAHYRAMAPALLTAFSTSSSSATLPVTLECLETRSKLSNRIASFVAPLGATVNMDGTALYECVAVLFIAQAYGVDLSLTTQLTVVILALLTSIGVAGIPAASLVAILVILDAVGLPAEGVGMILAVDRILDMCRTSVNVFSDSCGAVIIGKSEGEAVYK